MNEVDQSTRRSGPPRGSSDAAEARPIALTIAGSDSGGGAGIQADLRTFGRLGVFGTSAITAVTAQNLAGVRAVTGIPAAVVTAQVEAVFEGFAVGALKTGMLWSTEIIERVAELIARIKVPAVVDPVMIATSGARLLQEDAIAAYRDKLIPHCTLLTPNLDEARVLLDDDRDRSADPVAAMIETQADLDRVAAALGQRFGCAVLLKGGHLDGDPIDTLWQSGHVVHWHHRRLADVDTHGSGCMLAAAITAFLARGAEIESACERGLMFVHDALAHPLALTPGSDAEHDTNTIHLAGIERADSNSPHFTRS